MAYDAARSATILFSGSASQAAIAARDALAADFDVAAELWSATSYKALREDALSVERDNRLHPSHDGAERGDTIEVAVVTLDEHCAGLDRLDGVKVDVQGNPVDPTPFITNPAGFTIHSAIHMAREDAQAVMHLHTPAGQAVSAHQEGLLPLTQTAMAGRQDIAFHDYEGVAVDHDEREGPASGALPHHRQLLPDVHRRAGHARHLAGDPGRSSAAEA